MVQQTKQAWFFQNSSGLDGWLNLLDKFQKSEFIHKL